MRAINLVDAYNGAIGAAQQSLHGGGCSFHRLPDVSVYSLVVLKVKIFLVSHSSVSTIERK